MQDPQPYCKQVYWLSAEEAARLGEGLRSRGLKMRAAKGVVCTPLDPRSKIMSVAPEVWQETCARQGSWYRHSDKNGLTLVVSPQDLPELAGRKWATLTLSDFRPPRWATPAEKQALVAELAGKAVLPPEWKVVGEKEKRIYLRWAQRLGSDVEDYDRLFLSHTANHANFISPRFFVRRQGGMVPYSIDRSAHLCSSCAELYQVLGAGYPRKLVAPCPGATLFARLRPDQYLLVENQHEESEHAPLVQHPL